MDATATQGYKIASSKNAEVRAVLNELEKARKSGFDRLHVVLNAQEVVLALKGNYDCSIDPIISDIKAFVSWFYCVDLDCISRILRDMAHRLAKFCYSSSQDVG